jgi:5-methylcytosine-specific restriction endonuclease McrA
MTKPILPKPLHHANYDRITITCEFCGKQVEGRLRCRQARYKHAYCSKSCAISDKMRHDVGPLPATKFYRTAAWRKLRKEVIARDQACRECGITEADSHVTYGRSLHVDHIVPWQWGGSHDLDNLQALCVRCHAIKGRSGG